MENQNSVLSALTYAKCHALLLEFRSIIPVSTIDLCGVASGLIVLMLLVVRVLRWRKTAPNVFSYISEVLWESRKLSLTQNLKILVSVLFDDVATQRSSFPGISSNIVHFTTFWGFVGLTATTTLNWIASPRGDPLELTHPVRILGNISGALIMIGLTIALIRRIVSRSLRTRTSEYDIIFFTLIYASSLTGFIAEFTRIANLIAPAYVFYDLHIAFVSLLILTAPLTKFVHGLKLLILILFYRYRSALLEHGALVPTMPLAHQMIYLKLLAVDGRKLES